MKILASVITVVVYSYAGILAWSTWRKKVTAEERQQVQAQQLKKHKSEERKKAAEAAANQLTDEENNSTRIWPSNSNRQPATGGVTPRSIWTHSANMMLNRLIDQLADTGHRKQSSTRSERYPSG